MASNPFINDNEETLMSEINMTPLVDVMLVLLMIFLVTLPVMHHAIKLDLPQASNPKTEIKPTQIKLILQADGVVLLDQQAVDDATLRAHFLAAAKVEPQPEVHLYADRAVRYEHIARVMSAAQSGGLAKIGFITQPEANH
ncbi:MAG: outer membrane transport energization protein ExbD (TC 2.C.1.1.1) [Glomeribacter sp. 1016415]|nr:outer membrane transport energization protein ExbD (TC 2.C.1.1.1) [Glomeribacter sp. 1016415]